MQSDYIFVYGTLMRTCPTGAHQTYLANAKFIGTAKVKGNLHRVSYYPALVLDDAAGWVVGELYQLTSSAQLQQLDAYEECTYPGQPQQEYQRKIVDVQNDEGAVFAAWVYCYQHAVNHLPLIPSGDFLNP